MRDIVGMKLDVNTRRSSLSSSQIHARIHRSHIKALEISRVLEMLHGLNDIIFIRFAIDINETSALDSIGLNIEIF